jgi:transposase-like protein
MNLYSLTRRFPTEKEALDHLVKTRWPKGVRCLACNHSKCWLIKSTNKTGGPRHLYQCASCKFQFSATTGTLFHDSHLPLTKWFAAISLMSDAKKGISASQLRRHIGMTYKTAWYVAHRIREAMREAEDVQLGDPDTTVEIDEAYIGGHLRHKGSKVAQASKTMVIGMAERNGRVHLESMSNRRFESIKPVLDAKLAEDTKEVVTEWKSHLQAPHPQRETRKRKSRQGTCGAGLDNDANRRERVFVVQACHRRQLSQAQSLALGPLYARVLLEVQPAPHAAVDLRDGAGQYGQSNTVTVQDAGHVLNSILATVKIFPGSAWLPPRLDLRADFGP